MSSVKKRIAILGAGPIGLEAALVAVDRGHPAIVFERGEVGDSIQKWGHLKMFTPFGLNVSVRGIERLRRAGKTLPDPDAMLTATEYVAQYLAPLADTLGEAVRTNSEVKFVGKAELMKHELPGDSRRGEAPFRILLQRDERQWHEEAGIVLDCSGTFLTPNHLGDGGLPALGEETGKASIVYTVPDLLGRFRWMYENRRILVIGAGYSAATAIRDLCRLRKIAPETSIAWITRDSETPPCPRIPDDPLPERDAVAEAANRMSSSCHLDFRRGATVLSIRPRQELRGEEQLEVTLTGFAGRETIVVDRIIAAVGYRPNLELARELQLNAPSLQESTIEGMAGGKGGENAAEGPSLSRWRGGIGSLRQLEPGFFILGAKSFGRDGAFFIRDGREQIEAVFNWLDAAEASAAAPGK